MGQTINWPSAFFFDSNGDPLSGGLLNSYSAGTTARKALYSDRACTTPHTNPIVLDSNGGTGEVYGVGTYKLVLTDAAAAVTYFTDDNVTVAPQSQSVYYPDYNAADQGLTGDSNTIKFAVDTLSTDSGKIVLQHNSGGARTEYILGTSETIPSNIVLEIEEGAEIKPAAGISLTVNSPEHIIASPGQQIVDITNNSTDPLAFTQKGIVYAEWWGIDGSGDEIQINLANASLSGGGIVQLLAKEYLVDEVAASVSITPKSGVHIKGMGVDATSVKLADGEDSHIFNMATNTNTNIAITDMEIDGNRANQTAGVHGVRVGDDIDGLLLENLYVHDCFSYGIGAQVGTFKRITLDNIFVENTGSDGIDFKNTNDNSEHAVLNNIRVKAHGLNNALAAGQAGIDIRGQCHLSNITVTDYGSNTNDVIGIRFRTGVGSGAHYSTLNNFYIEADSAAGNFGLEHNAHQTMISNGFVKGCEYNYRFTQMENVLSNLIAHSGTNGFYFKNAGDTTDPDRNMCSSLIARSVSATGFIVEGDENVFTSCAARGNTTNGIVIIAGATFNQFIGGYCGNNGTEFVDGGTTTKIRNMAGVVTEKSGTTNIPNGTDKKELAHGLYFTPSVQDISIIGMEDPTNDVGTIWIDSIDATNFTVNVEEDPGASNWSFGWSAKAKAY